MHSDIYIVSLPSEKVGHRLVIFFAWFFRIVRNSSYSSTDKFLDHSRKTINSRLLSVGQQSADRRGTVGQQTTDSWPTNDRQLADKRPTVGRQKTDSQPTNNGQFADRRLRYFRKVLYLPTTWFPKQTYPFLTTLFTKHETISRCIWYTQIDLPTASWYFWTARSTARLIPSSTLKTSSWGL